MPTQGRKGAKKQGSRKGGTPQTRAERERAARQQRAGGGSAAPRPAAAMPAPESVATGRAPGDDEPLRYFVDVGVVRVQSYLTRTSDLRGFRGASMRVSTETSREAWEAKLPAAAQFNDEAGDVDGVVSLEVTALDAESAASQCARVATGVATQLRLRLPAAYLSAVVGEGRTYVEAYEVMKQRRLDGDLAVDWPPPVPEVVLAKPCDRCRSWPAVALIRDHSHNETVDRTDEGCRDCLTRYPDVRGGGRRSHAETRLYEALSAADHDVTGFPQDFADLADGEHLALVYCDGNRVGEALTAAADAGLDTRAIAPAISDATIAALVDALIHTHPELPALVPILPHILGGDDVQVTAPADTAWRIATAMLRSFDTRINAAVAALATKKKKMPRMSMSGGVVFFHRATPLVDVVDFAATQLGSAKRGTRGAAASLAFLDVPVDGDLAPATRPVLTLADLERWADRLVEVAALPAAHRATVLGLLRAGDEGEARTRLTRQASTVVFDLEADGLDPRTQLELARWWPAS